MEAASSDGSFVDHGQEAEMCVGSRPEWTAEKSGDVTCDEDDNDEDDATSLSVDAVGLEAAVKTVNLLSGRLLRSNRKLAAENRALERERGALTDAVAALTKGQQELQHTIVELVRELKEVKTTMQSLIDVSTRK